MKLGPKQKILNNLWIALILLVAETDNYTELYQDSTDLIMRLLMIAIPIFVVIAVVKMIFNHIRAH